MAMPQAGTGLLQAQQSQSHNCHTAIIGFALTVWWTAVASPSEGHCPDCKEVMGLSSDCSICGQVSWEGGLHGACTQPMASHEQTLRSSLTCTYWQVTQGQAASMPPDQAGAGGGNP